MKYYPLDHQFSSFHVVLYSARTPIKEFVIWVKKKTQLQIRGIFALIPQPNPFFNFRLRTYSTVHNYKGGIKPLKQNFFEVTPHV